MDNEQQIQLKFLDEAEDCLDWIESTLLGLANTTPNPQDLDRALRFAHSVKGGAAMMGFMSLSRVAHKVEDYFKILRVRYHAQPINTAVETLLLQSVDCLRQVMGLHRQGTAIDENWLSAQSDPIFAQLQHYLGELRPEDEDALLAQEEECDPALLMFEDGVETAVERLDGEWTLLSGGDLRQELRNTALELVDFGRMANLESFIQLCQSVAFEAENVANERLGEVTLQALKLWRKSLSLVALRRLENLPNQLFQGEAPDLQVDADEIQALESNELSDVQAAIANLNFPDNEHFSFFETVDGEIPSAALEEVDILNPQSISSTVDATDLENFEGMEISDIELSELSLELDEISLPNVEVESDFLSELQGLVGDFLAQESEALSQDNAVPVAAIPPIEVLQPTPATSVQPQPRPADSSESRQTVRVPVKSLQQFNNAFGQLILERNAVNLRLEQLQSFNRLLRERVERLESSNRQLRQWYDHASLEGLIPTSEGPLPTSGVEVESSPPHQSTLQENFDVLEMDRYSDLHLISQDQIESIVQLQEVTADIDLSLQEITQSVRDFNQTTRSLQTNMTQLQMVPFADAVKRFPRVVRDLSLQYGKPVNLKIVGEHTRIDRSILDQLSDPLLHLLRNAFDHGIETSETRLAAAKPVEGQITIAASHRGGQTIIQISDDGRGIDINKIRTRLQNLGLPYHQVMGMGEAELLDFIFEPGFSTAETVSELSGRGVGMDVVRTNLQQLRGDISVVTQPGQGTQFTIQVPFTLSIMRVMVLEQAGIVFSVAVDSVKELTRFQPEQVSSDGSQIFWQDQTIPLLYLENGLTYNRPAKPFTFSNTPTISQPTLLVIGEGKSLIGFHIDRFWGEQEVTIRPIETLMPLPPGFNSSILLGDGRVVPLVDPIQLATWLVNQATGSLEQRRHSAPAIPTNFTSTMAKSTNTILVVDDSIHVRRYLALTLEKAGYNVEQARDGQEAVERLMGGLEVQAVVCDIEMPRLDGYGVLETLRDNTRFEHLPITMLTSRSSEKHRKLAMNLGASAYFSKPYTEQELLQKIKELIHT